MSLFTEDYWRTNDNINFQDPACRLTACNDSAYCKTYGCQDKARLRSHSPNDNFTRPLTPAEVGKLLDEEPAARAAATFNAIMQELGEPVTVADYEIGGTWHAFKKEVVEAALRKHLGFPQSSIVNRQS